MSKKQKKKLIRKLKELAIDIALWSFLIYSVLEIEKGIIIWLYA